MEMIADTPTSLPVPDAEVNYISIRGKHLPLQNLLDPRLSDEAYVLSLRDRFRRAEPFEHLVIDDWFNPLLLQMAEEEFDLFPPESWRGMNNKYETTLRSQPGSTLGPASQIYFDLVNSARFISLLSTITSVEDLITDPYLYGGGLHQSKSGGRFGIHRDFDRHVRTGLHNTMVLLTYLNREWDPSWNGDLELWDGEKQRCVTTVSPVMGRSILLRHGKSSYHGHPRPMTMPEGKVRRSLASYYYANAQAKEDREKRITSVFLFTDKSDYIRQLGKRWTPPVVWEWLKRIAKH